MQIGTRRHELYNGMLFITGLVSPLPECWEREPEVYKTVRKISLKSVTKQEIADFFSLRPGTKTFKEFMEIQKNSKWWENFEKGLF